MSTALRSVGLLDVLSSTPAESRVARLVSMPVRAAPLRHLVRDARQGGFMVDTPVLIVLSCWVRTRQA